MSSAAFSRPLKGIRPRTKRHRMLCHFASGASLNSLEASQMGDSVLTQTVFGLERKYRLEFTHKLVIVRGFMGSTATVMQYKLTDAGLARARKILKAGPKEDVDFGFCADVTANRGQSAAAVAEGGAP